MPPAITRGVTAAFLVLSCFFAPAGSAANTAALWQALASGGHVAMIRHAYAPGGGDPENFRIGDCSTQRNLNDEGREQARRAGDAFRENGVTVARILSSEWCRCQETASLLALGDVETFPALNSLHARRHNEERQVTALKAFLKDLPKDGPAVVLVSHHATIGALADAYPRSGEIVVARLSDDGGFRVIGSIPPP
jgi:broad specificity phosphatase PhoE